MKRIYRWCVPDNTFWRTWPEVIREAAYYWACVVAYGRP